MRLARSELPSPVGRNFLSTSTRVAETMTVFCALLFFSGATWAAPTANNQTFALDLFGANDVTFNIHDVGLVAGGPAPVYLLDVQPPVGQALPLNLAVTRADNACINISWDEDPNGDPQTFQFSFTLIGGDQSVSNSGTITVEQGGEPIPTGTPCDVDPNNVAPTTQPLAVQATQGTPVTITPIPPNGASVNDQNGNDTVRLTDIACWTQSPNSASLVRISDTEIEYTPPVGFTGPDTFEYCVTDNPLSSATGVLGQVTVDVVAAGAPGVANDNAQTDIATPVEIDVLANDAIGDAGTIDSASAPVNGGAAVVLPDGACAGGTAFGQGCIRYTPPGPDADGFVFVGTDTFNYVVSDANGNTAQASVTVNVVAPPGTPEPLPDAAAGVVAGVPTEIDVLVNDSDDGGVAGLTIVSVSAPGSGSAEITDRPGQTQVITYTADDTFAGSDEFFYTVSDGDPTTIDRQGRVSINVIQPELLLQLSPFALNATQRAVAEAIDVVCPALGDLQAADPNNPLPPGQEALLNRCSGLIEYAEDAGDVQGVRTALQQIAGEEALAQGTTGTAVVNTQMKNISSRLAALRSGVTGISVAGLGMDFNSGSLPVGMLLNRKGGGASADDDASPELLADSRLGLFINGRVNFGEQDPTINEDGFDFDTLGVTAGADYRFRNNLVVGAAVGYADAEVDFNLNGGDLQTQALTYSFYGTYFSDSFYADVLAGTGGADYDTRRILVFQDARGGVDTTAVGSTDGDQSVVSASIGYNFERGGWVISPHAGYDYLNTEIDPYTESEGQGWELAFGKPGHQVKNRHRRAACSV